ncbi:MAG: hypothetical protein A2Y82_04980 [Candidatus Buchananbacteria bacterium RBG_13_36_9]|uniref:WxL domain-containing protein n=1 Tax=Candidatus Buchananbacteria bacterium RBG_13_36_9 TaxID=1797530 RepID=A0A1G1XQW0_9BACT|nr:MAG: hypothetical protein A2Y82_04980 [Candidatus Buchananbacteria bacterium RBG_13_36_9]
MLKVKNKIITSVKIVVFAIILTLAHQSWAAMDSTNYQIWLDNLGAYGGKVNSDNYKIDSNFKSESGAISQSNTFREKVSFSSIADEPTVGFNVQEITLNFGQLSSSSTAYTSHTFSAYTNSSSGYTIKIYGEPLKTSYYTLTAIGGTAQNSTIGTEQFGINLVSNSTPLIGADPDGGIGQTAANYDTTNKYAYLEGDIIASADNFSYQTDFTVSVIVNIADTTPAGNYSTILTYEFIPIF